METVEVGVSDPDVAVLRLSVYDRSRATDAPSLLCSAALPAAALRPGYSNAPLRDADGCKVAFCKLLLHVRVSNTHPPLPKQAVREAPAAEQSPPSSLVSGLGSGLQRIVTGRFGREASDEAAGGSRGSLVA